MRSGKYYQGIKVNGKKIDLHRYLGEQIAGRPLEDDEVIHHIDGDKHNNNLDNLQVMKRKDHSRLHAEGKTLSPEARSKLSRINTGRPNYASRKLSDSNAKRVFALRDKGMTFRAIGKTLEISHHCVIDIYYGKYYKNVNPNLQNDA